MKFAKLLRLNIAISIILSCGVALGMEKIITQADKELQTLEKTKFTSVHLLNMANKLARYTGCASLLAFGIPYIGAFTVAGLTGHKPSVNKSVFNKAILTTLLTFMAGTIIEEITRTCASRVFRRGAKNYIDAKKLVLIFNPVKNLTLANKLNGEIIKKMKNLQDKENTIIESYHQSKNSLDCRYSDDKRLVGCCSSYQPLISINEYTNEEGYRQYQQTISSIQAPMSLVAKWKNAKNRLLEFARKWNCPCLRRGV